MRMNTNQNTRSMHGLIFDQRGPYDIQREAYSWSDLVDVFDLIIVSRDWKSCLGKGSCWWPWTVARTLNLR